MCLLYPWSNCYQLLLYRSEIKWNRISCISSPFFTLRSNLTLSHISVGLRACAHHCCQGWLHKPHLISFRTFISSCPLSQLFPRICFLLWTCWFCCFGLCHKDTNSFYHVFLPIQESVVNPILRWVLITFITATLAPHWVLTWDDTTVCKPSRTRPVSTAKCVQNSSQKCHPEMIFSGLL